MAILDIFKKKKKPAKEVKKLAVPAQEVKKIPEVKAKRRPAKRKKEIKPGAPLKPKKVSDIAYRVLKEPHVTEKATDLTSVNQYVFKVWPRTNKVEIKKAVEDLYGVDVLDVNIIKVPPKKRRLGRIEGWRKGYKKAIIKVKKGQKIELLPR